MLCINILLSCLPVPVSVVLSVTVGLYCLASSSLVLLAILLLIIYAAVKIAILAVKLDGCTFTQPYTFKH